ncbi:MAG: membrane dipeptidase [Bacteroidetes bacterium]|jgi:membrane dipeptidase|nr:membrane dipeptidase [Bacteroidota bacterium]
MKLNTKFQLKLTFKKTFLFYLLTIIVVFSSCENQKDSDMTQEQLLAMAKDIHNRVITLDTHCDIDVNNFTDSVNYTQDLRSQVTLPKMNKGGLDVAWFVVYTGQDSLTETGYQNAYDNAMSKFDAIKRLVTEIAPNEIELAVTSEDVKRIHASGKKVAMIGIENGYPIGLDINNVKKFHDLGGRYMSLSHNGHSQLSDSNTGEKDDVWLHNGLSDFGKKVIAEMNKWGIMIDISHPSKEAIRQMIALSKAPVIASHSSARALNDHSRNLDDEQLFWIKDNGGVVQTVAFKTYVNQRKQNLYNDKISGIRDAVIDSLNIRWYSWPEFSELDSNAQNKFLKNRNMVMALVDDKVKSMTDFPPQVNVSDFVDHIDYMVDKIGLKHVGISSDFDGGGGVDGWNDASETFNVTLELVKRGYTESDISQLWSGNLLRVLDDVELIAKNLQAQ